MTTLKWKHLEEAVRARIEVLENITQGALLLDLTGVVGDYQMTREESLNSVIVMFCDDAEPAIGNVILFNAPDNPDKYTIINCNSGSASTGFIAGIMTLPAIEMQAGVVTKVIYGYTLAFEELLTKLKPEDHGDVSVGGDKVTWTIKPVAKLHETPQNPPSTTSVDGVMVGLACKITPVRTTSILAIISGDIGNDNVSGQAIATLRTGTGAAPENGDALAGVPRSAGVTVINPDTAVGRYPFSVQAIVSGLEIGTEVWVDLGLSAQSGGEASLRNLNISIVEI